MRQGLLPKLGYGLALIVTTVLAVVPPLGLAPVIGPYLLVAVPVIVAIVLQRAYSSPRMRATILILTTVGAALALGTGLIVRNLPPFTAFELPTPHVIGPAFQLDGELAYDAGEYELWCEIYLALSLSVIFSWAAVKAVGSGRNRAG